MNNISVIIPAYNAAKTIGNTLKSLQEQTLKDFEIIIIDDGSTDDTESIVKEYMINNNIAYFKNDNHGVSYSRNYGIRKSKSKYLLFVDADDQLPNDAIHNYYNEINDDPDMIIGGDILIANGRKSQVTAFENRLRSREEIVSDPFRYKGTPWAKLFKREIIIDNDLCFDISLSFGEDQVFFTKYLLSAEKIKTISSITYLYYIDNSNLSKQKGKAVVDRLKALIDLKKILQNYEMPINKYDLYVILEKISCWARVSQLPEYEDYAESLKNEIRLECKNKKIYRECTLYQKIKVLIYMLCPSLYRKIMYEKHGL